MNTIRMIAIALPMTLLLACGGGGGGGTAAVSPTAPPTMMPGTDDPMTPPTNMPGTDDTPVTLPEYAIMDVSAARMVSGTAPTITSQTDIVNAIQTIATAGNRLIGGDAAVEGGIGTDADIPTTCSGTSCSVTLSGDDVTTFSLNGVASISPIDDTNLFGFNTEIRSISVKDNVMLVESRIGARQRDDTTLTFQSYGGWLTESGFGVDKIRIPATGDGTTFRVFPYSFGNVDASGSKPTGTSRAVWSGIAVSMALSTDIISQGEVEIDIDDFSNINVDVVLRNFKNLNTGRDLQTTSTFDNISLNDDGTFEKAINLDAYIRGSFYGTGHMEVGGVFHDSIFDLVGAFGATRQP